MPSSANLRTTLAATLLAGLTLFSSPARAAETDTRAQLTAWKSEAESLDAQLNALYGRRAAPATLRHAFKVDKIGWAQRYADTWAGWISADFKATRHLPQSTITNLTNALKQLGKSNTLPGSQLAALHSDMQQLRTQHRQLQQLFATLVECNVRQARAIDREHADRMSAYKARRAGQEALAAQLEGRSDDSRQRAEGHYRQSTTAANLIRSISRGLAVPDRDLHVALLSSN